MTRPALLLLLALALAACGGGDGQTVGQSPGDQGSDPQQSVSDGDEDDGAALPSSDADGTRMALPEAREVRDGVRDLRARQFERALWDETDGSLHVIYFTGVEPCTVLGDVEVEEHADQVVVTLLEGHLPDDGGEQPVCIEIAEEVSARVPLDGPLDDRELIDGATGDPVPVDLIRQGDAAAG